MLATASKPRQCLLEGFGKGGKSAALAMLVHWARTQGWLVFYLPNGREWTSVGMYFKNAQTGLWDTPIQAKTSLEVTFTRIRALEILYLSGILRYLLT